MAQVNSEEGGGQKEMSYEEKDPSVESGRQRYDEIIKDACKGDGLGRVPPTSQVGYGGCNRASNNSPELKSRAEGGEKEEMCGRDLYGKGRQAVLDGEERGEFGRSEDLPQATRRDGEIYHSESKFPGPKHESEHEDTGSEPTVNSEGMPRGAPARDAESRAGLSSGAGETKEAYQYHQTGAPLPDHKNSPYSQAFTESDGPPGGVHYRFQEDENALGNTEGGSAPDGQEEKEGVKAKLKKLLPTRRHDEKQDVVANAGDELVGAPNKDGQVQPGLVTKLKNKVMAGHHKDEPDPSIFS